MPALFIVFLRLFCLDLAKKKTEKDVSTLFEQCDNALNLKLPQFKQLHFSRFQELKYKFCFHFFSAFLV